MDANNGRPVLVAQWGLVDQMAVANSQPLAPERDCRGRRAVGLRSGYALPTPHSAHGNTDPPSCGGQTNR